MVPFAASAKFYSGYLARLLDGHQALTEPEGKDRVRTRIAGDILLTLPVEGGGAVMKRRDVTGVRLSDHGRWQDVHLGALRAAYGRTPFFSHLFPDIEAVYREKSDGEVADFTKAIHRIIEKWLGCDAGFLNELRRLRDEDRERLREWKSRFERNFDPDLSILDLLFHYGKESVIALL